MSITHLGLAILVFTSILAGFALIVFITATIIDSNRDKP